MAGLVYKSLHGL